jgi:hypothetical protein
MGGEGIRLARQLVEETHTSCKQRQQANERDQDFQGGGIFHGILLGE